MRKSGRRATAEIISIKTVGEGKSIRSIRELWAPGEDLSSSWVDCHLRLRVIPDEHGEPPFEVRLRITLVPSAQASGDEYA